MTYSLCAYERQEPFFTRYHWCNHCPPNSEYVKLERAQKVAHALMIKNRSKNDR